MNELIQHDVLSEVLRAVSDSRPAPEGPHVVDDDELLLRWSDDGLSQEEHTEIVRHLADCSYCRKELAGMVQAGVFTPPQRAPEPEPPCKPAWEEESLEPPAIVTPAESARKRRTWLVWAVPTVAAGLLIGVLWSLREADVTKQLAVAQRDLAAGRPQSAFHRVETILDERTLHPQAKALALRLLEKSGYAATLPTLDANKFQEVLDIEHRVSRHHASSPRLLNLKLQAERGVPAELALVQLASLTDYGYELDGFSRQMSIPIFDQTSERLNRELAQAVGQHPNDVRLLLNYGQFLLSMAQCDKAREQFDAALVQDKGNPLARLGLGLVEFESKNCRKALNEFQAAIEIDPDQLAAYINAAICLERLERSEEAQRYWRQAVQLCKARPDLREQIKARILEK